MLLLVVQGAPRPQGQTVTGQRLESLIVSRQGFLSASLLVQNASALGMVFRQHVALDGDSGARFRQPDRRFEIRQCPGQVLALQAKPAASVEEERQRGLKSNGEVELAERFIIFFLLLVRLSQ